MNFQRLVSSWERGASSPQTWPLSRSVGIRMACAAGAAMEKPRLKTSRYARRVTLVWYSMDTDRTTAAP